MDKKTALGILHLDETATLAEAKKAYRSLAKQYHPDVIENKPSAETDTGARMKDINLAFRYLTPFLKLNRPVKKSSESIPDDAPAEKQPVGIKKKGWGIFFSRCEGFIKRLFLTKENPVILKDQKRYPKKKNGHGRDPFCDVLKKVAQPVSSEKQKSGSPKKRIRSKTVSMADYRKYTQLKHKMKSGRSGHPGVPVGRVTKIDPVDGIYAVKND